jgi:hypothetical protein
MDDSSQISSRVSDSLSESELTYLRSLIGSVTPCRMLIIGCGYCAPAWETLNADGETVFVTENNEWGTHMQRTLAASTVVAVDYNASPSKWRFYLQDIRDCKQVSELSIGLPSAHLDKTWSLVIFDQTPSEVHPVVSLTNVALIGSLRISSGLVVFNGAAGRFRDLLFREMTRRRPHWLHFRLDRLQVYHSERYSKPHVSEMGTLPQENREKGTQGNAEISGSPHSSAVTATNGR